ncbi:hypothetical protein H0H87_011010 [Tephrocybe sp. NHM501043]|nr:hypothetical protein H0H87_011010 [Tephrocybe sp. NHM501043]
MSPSSAAPCNGFNNGSQLAPDIPRSTSTTLPLSKSLQRSPFVEDLVYMILESSDHWWPADLVQLSRVSSAWLEPVRRRLFAEPSVLSFRSCARLAQALSANPSLVNLVKGIELRPMPGADRYISSQDRASLNSILATEGLLHITLGGLLSVRAERFLHRIADPQSISSVHIDGSSMAHCLSPADCPSLEWDESIAFQFSGLKTLRLTNIELAVSTPSIPYQLQISHLHFDHVTITRGFISQLLHETPTLSCLRVRTAHASELDEQVRCVLDSCAVELLEFEADVEGPLAHPIFDNNSSSLRTLRLVNVHVDIDTINLIEEHCRWLEDLSILGRTVTVLPREWISFIHSGKLIHLRSLQLPCRSRLSVQWSGSAIDELMKVADVHGVHVSGC